MFQSPVGLGESADDVCDEYMAETGLFQSPVG